MVRLVTELIPIVTDFAWGERVHEKKLHKLLDCASDCQQNIPEFFLDDYLIQKRKDGQYKPRNPLMLGNPFIPFEPNKVLISARCVLLLKRLTDSYLRENRVRRKPLLRFVDRPIIHIWNRLLDRLSKKKFPTHLDLKPAPPDEDTERTRMVFEMVKQLPYAGRINKYFWKKKPPPPTHILTKQARSFINWTMRELDNVGFMNFPDL